MRIRPLNTMRKAQRSRPTSFLNSILEPGEEGVVDKLEDRAKTTYRGEVYGMLVMHSYDWRAKRLSFLKCGDPFFTLAPIFVPPENKIGVLSRFS